MAQQSNKTLPLPYFARLHKPMEVGQTLTIQGEVWDENVKELDVNSVMINLNTDDRGPNSQYIVMHANFRFAQGKTIFNSCFDGNWEKEESEGLPLKQGHRFDIRIRAKEDFFEIDVDGKDFHKYKYRMALDKFRHLYINGPISLHSVSWAGQLYDLPYDTRISITPGRRIYMSGTPNKNAKMITVNLKTESDDIAFHFNIRFNEGKVVRNSCEKGYWGASQDDGDFPFKKSRTFDLLYVCTTDGYMVIVDREDFCFWRHQFAPDQVSCLEISGDLELHSVQEI